MYVVVTSEILLFDPNTLNLRCLNKLTYFFLSRNEFERKQFEKNLGYSFFIDLRCNYATWRTTKTCRWGVLHRLGPGPHLLKKCLQTDIPWLGNSAHQRCLREVDALLWLPVHHTGIRSWLSGQTSDNHRVVTWYHGINQHYLPNFFSKINLKTFKSNYGLVFKNSLLTAQKLFFLCPKHPLHVKFWSSVQILWKSLVCKESTPTQTNNSMSYMWWC